MKKTLTLMCITLLSSALMSQSFLPMPSVCGNPVIKHIYTADASPHVMPDGRVYMVTSIDKPGGGYNTMLRYHIFSSADMRTWKDHGEVMSVENQFDVPDNEDWALWAPDMIYDNGAYYIVYPLRITPKKNTTGGRDTRLIGLAKNDTTDGQFTIVKESIEGKSIGIDPCIFRDDDGELYLYHGPGRAGKLNNNLEEFEFVEDGKYMNINKTNDPLLSHRKQNEWTGSCDNRKFEGHMMEAPWMYKRKGKYFLNYHTFYGRTVKHSASACVDRNTCGGYHEDDPKRRKSLLDFAYGDSPLEPMTYGGTLNKELGDGLKDKQLLEQYNYTAFNGQTYVPWRPNQSNHGGVVEFHGTDYLFYHTSALSSWNNSRFTEAGSWTNRSVCIDIIEYDENDMPLPVVQTIAGVPAVSIEQPFEIVLAQEIDYEQQIIIGNDEK